MAKQVKRTIGWRERIDFVDFGLDNIQMKTDTGALTSVLHCSSIELVKRYRKQYVKFVLLDPTHKKFNGKEFTLPFHKEKKVKNSFGHEENRYIVETRVKIFGRLHTMEISLRDRSNLEYPGLMGRRFIRGKFIVDVEKSNLSYKKKKNKLKENISSPK